MEFITNSPLETEKVGEALGKVLKPGSILAYAGDLGAGKTAFTRGLARGLGAAEQVTSPTYTIVNEYLTGRMPLFHFDMYRLASSDDLWDIGWEDYLGRCVRRGVERECSGSHGRRDYRLHPETGRRNAKDHHHRRCGS